MNPCSLFPEHVRTLQARYEETLGLLAGKDVRIEAVLLHAGPTRVYFADDRPVPFQPYGHYSHWLPIRHPEQMVLVRPGERPVYFRVQRKTYWTDESIPAEPWWADAFEVVDLAEPGDVIDHLPAARRIAFMGEDTAFAQRIGLPSTLQNEKHLRNRLDYHRALKTPYETARIREATRPALRGHRAAHEAFLEGASEAGIRQAYLAGCPATVEEMPYDLIIGLDAHAAILHYTRQTSVPSHDNHLLLVDAGAMAGGYASDITRTFLRDSAHPVLRELRVRVEQLMHRLIDICRAGRSFKEINDQAHEGALDIVLDLELAAGSRDELTEQKISKLFLPHGVGHLLGIQVHDVSGLFKDATGVLEPPPHEHKELRLTRQLEPDMILTVEPGFYFIPMLLEPERTTEKGRLLNYALLDGLMPLGGVRMEDNILVTRDGVVNLTAEEAATLS
jgi:Xaa-Pro dipeptidase